MKKKIRMLLGLLALLLVVTGCSQKETAVTYNEENLEKVAEVLINYCKGTDAQSKAQMKKAGEFALQLQLVQAQLPVEPRNFFGVVDSWDQAVKECGSYEGHGDFSLEEKNDGIRLVTTAQFEKREAELVFEFNKEEYLESLTVNAQYSTGEILKKAGMNTVLGMGTVFLVLIFISALISLFRFIPLLEAKQKKKLDLHKAEKAEETAKDGGENVLSQTSAGSQEDPQLVAVIAAAIAAAEDRPADGIVIRSIRRRPANNWKK